MRRLPDEQRADVLLSRGMLDAPTIDAHRGPPRSFPRGGPRRRGGRAASAAPRRSPATSRRTSRRPATSSSGTCRDEAAEIEQWQTAFLRGHRELFERRAATGRIRDGHGDLRLEHVYLEDVGEPTIIDCIEFSDRFRFADVCADVAFLSMDLEAHGRVDLAERLLARYARETNDFDLYALVDFYESYRAFVRAKVAAMLAADAGVAEATRRRAAAEARRHFLLALAADRRWLLQPAVVAVGGLIASGKSTVAERLADEMGAPVVEADRTRKSMVGVDAHHPVHEASWAGAYDPRFTDRVYAELMRRAEVVLASGRPVVLDASFRSPGFRDAARQLAIAHGVPFRFVECRVDPAVCRERLSRRDRTSAVSDGRLEVFDAFRSRFEAVTELCATEHIVLDTSRPIEDSLATLRAHLATWPLGFVA